MFDNIILSIIWEQKGNIIAGIFLGLTIYSYFYKVKIRELNILKLKTETRKLKIYKDYLITVKMSDKETYQLKEVLDNFAKNTGKFEDEVRKEFKDIHEKIDNKITSVINVLTDYIVSNDKRVGDLEKSDAVQNARLLMYVSTGVYIIGIAISIIMSFSS